MKTRLNIASSTVETGALLKEYLTKRGVDVTNKAENLICYGLSGNANRVLNASCKLDKMERLRIMDVADVATVNWFSADEYLKGNFPIDMWQFPLFARKAMGHGGTDLVPVFQPEEVPWRIAAGWDWFSEWVEVARELRVWVFRDEHLDTYEKVMRRPEDFKYLGRNFRNGFDFQITDEVPGASSEAINAVVSLGLDFGAVDLLFGKDEHVYILEVNTAPGVIKSGAEATLGKLADRMVDWLKAA